MIHNLRDAVIGLIDLEDPPDLAFRPRKSALGLSKIRAASAWEASKPQETVLGLILLWHDHWTESHAIAQAHEGISDFDLLHAIGHRREGDFGNSLYWFEEAGCHPMFEKLSHRVDEWMGKNGELHRSLLPKGKWNPKAFVQSVKQNPENPVLRSIQALEFECFLDFLVSGSK